MRSCVHDAILRSRRIRYATVPRIAKWTIKAMYTQGGMLDWIQSIINSHYSVGSEEARTRAVAAAVLTSFLVGPLKRGNGGIERLLA